MAEIDAETLADRVSLLGLAPRGIVNQAQAEATDGSVDALSKILLRRQILTSWQLERLKKGEVSGFLFGGCKVLFHLAEGTFARVYRGIREMDHRPVAIKVMRNRFVGEPGAIDRFYQEAEAGMKLVHPNIVQVYDYGEEEGKYYMIMEYVEGSNLRDFLKYRHRLDAGEGMPLVLGLARGLQYSLSQGVTHRDIKGTNILIASRGEAKLVDFGLATIDGDKKAAAAHGQRTVDYSALERTCGSPKGDPRSDIYFLGCVYYQMLTGILPLPEVEASDPLAKMLKRSFGAIRPIRELRGAPPEELCVIIDKMMQIDLTKRYQTMDAVVADLEVFDEQLRAGTATPILASGDRNPNAVEQAKPKPQAENDALDFLNDPAGFLGTSSTQSEAKGHDASADAATSVPAPVVSSPARPVPTPSQVPPSAEADDEDDDEHDNFMLEAFEVAEIRKKQVLCVEAQDVIQEALRRALSKMGYRVLLLNDAERAAERFREIRPDALVFDFDGLGPNGIEAYFDMHERAHEEGQELRALVLLGPRQGELARRLPTDDRVVILTKPLKMKDVQEALRHLIPAKIS